MWLLALVATVGLHVESVDDLPLSKAAAVTDELVNLLETTTSSTFVVDSTVWTDCTRADRCVEQIRARTRATDVVMLKFFGGVRSFRLSAERLRRGASQAAVFRADLPVDGPWDEALAALAGKLYAPSTARPPPVVVIEPNLPTTPPIAWEPWALSGVAVGALATGIVFGLSASNAAGRLENRLTIDSEYDRLSRRSSSHATVANVLVGTAVVTGVVAAAWWILDDP